jgi:hypothetical protein
VGPPHRGICRGHICATGVSTSSVSYNISLLLCICIYTYIYIYIAVTTVDVSKVYDILHWRTGVYAHSSCNSCNITSITQYVIVFLYVGHLNFPFVGHFCGLVLKLCNTTNLWNDKWIWSTTSCFMNETNYFTGVWVRQEVNNTYF